MRNVRVCHVSSCQRTKQRYDANRCFENCWKMGTHWCMGCWVTPGRGKRSPLQGLSLLPELQSCRSPGLTASLPHRGQTPCPALLCCGSGRAGRESAFLLRLFSFEQICEFFLSLVEYKSAYWIVLNVALSSPCKWAKKKKCSHLVSVVPWDFLIRIW